MPRPETLVSVIITNYNYGRFVGQAIDSALRQTYPQVEVIVVDDGSTDNSREVIAGYGDHIRARWQANAGQGAAYNMGFALSRGEIVVFLDSDDMLEPDAIAQAVAAFGADVSKTQYYLRAVDADGQDLGRTLPALPFSPADPLQHLRLYGYYTAPPGSGAAYSRTFLAQVMPMPAEQFRYGADGYVSVLAPLFGRVVSLDRPLALYRIHERNVSEVSGADVAKLRRLLLIDRNREGVLQRAAARRGIVLRSDRMLNIPGHVKWRLMSLRLDHAHHPFPRDRVWRLALAGLKAAWVFPHTTLRKKLISSLGFLILPLIPAALAERLLGQATAAQHRHGLLRLVTS
jgi:glycosyltransferase involved in cell wall biosynthesis